jgi:hypothetical protein
MARPSGLERGSIAPKSGLYQQVGPKGGEGHEVTSVKGESIPPTTMKGATYTLVDGTTKKSGR